MPVNKYNPNLKSGNYVKRDAYVKYSVKSVTINHDNAGFVVMNVMYM